MTGCGEATSTKYLTLEQMYMDNIMYGNYEELEDELKKLDVEYELLTGNGEGASMSITDGEESLSVYIFEEYPGYGYVREDHVEETGYEYHYRIRRVSGGHEVDIMIVSPDKEYDFEVRVYESAEDTINAIHNEMRLARGEEIEDEVEERNQDLTGLDKVFTTLKLGDDYEYLEEMLNYINGDD